MRKQYFIDTFSEGFRVDDTFLVKASRLSETRAGKPYLLLELGDKSGEISGPVWENAEKLAGFCAAGKFVRVRGTVQSYREKLQLRIEEISPVAQENVVLEDFVPSSERDIDEMAEELRHIISQVENTWIRKLLNRFFLNGHIWEKFKYAPAAKAIHHAYCGGLLEHCLSMAQITRFISAHYRGVDESLLLAGVLFHDIGKLDELVEQAGVVDYTPQGRLKGHLVLGSEMVAREAAQISGFPEDLLIQIQHLILSHHGKLEFGSPTVPMTPEALVLSYLDDLDSKMNLIEQLRRKQRGEGMAWSEYQRPLERFLYLSPLPPEEKQNEAEIHNKQKLLF